ncbi:MAG: GNAT family N-acetyltransferase [Spirochaetaceae bacterium]
MESLTYRFEPITYADVLVMERWRYKGFEPAIYMDRYHESKDRGDSPIKGPRGCIGYTVYNTENIMFGLMEYYFEDDGVYLGLAINPEFIGKGLSQNFIFEGIEFLKSNYNLNKQIKIEVHRRNIQAIKAYEKCGFKFVKRDEEILLYLCP